MDETVGASFSAVCGLEFTPSDSIPDASDPLLASSAVVLRALNAVDEGVQRTDAQEQQQQFLRMLDGKVTLLMQMVAQLLSQRGQGLPRVHARLFASAVSWSGHGAPPQGGGILTLILNPAIAVPVQLPVQIAGVELEGEGEWRAVANLASLSADCQDAWDHYVFRHHRREIAASRG